MQGAFDRLSQDVRGGMRSLLKYPVSCAVAVISLAGGIGATTATLMIRDVVFRRPPALYRDPGSLSKVQVGSPQHPIRAAGSPVPGALYAIWRADLGEAMAAVAPEQIREVRTDDRREGVRIRRVTPNFFATLGVDPALGRTFPTDERDGSRTAVVSYRVWRFLLNGRADVVGTRIWIGSDPYTVAGVMPERFWFSSMNSPIWIPLDAAEARAENGVEVVVRRPREQTSSSLAERLQRGLSTYVAGLPAADRQQSLKVSGIEGTPAGNSMPLALPWLLATAVLLTVVIACANVAILVIAQWTAREHEIAVRAALGASRGRIVRALVTESILLATTGGIFGILATLVLRGLIVRNAGPAIAFFDLSLDPRTLIEAIGVTLVAGVAAGIGPALFETRRLHGNPMRTIASSDHLRQRWRHALVVLEIAVTVALLVVTGGMVNTYSRNYRTDIGYSTHPLVLLRVQNEKGVPVARLREHLIQLPGVANAAPSTSVPFFSGAAAMQRMSTERTGAPAERAEFGAIGPDYFATLGVSMRAGRGFTSQDSPATRTAIVNELLASRLFPGRHAVGQTLWIGDTPHDVVGVVANYKNAALQPAERDAKAFVPIDAAASPTQMTFVIRAAADAAATERTIRRDAPAVAAGTAVAGSSTLDGIIDISGQEILVGTAPLAPLIATGMLLTAAGIYGVLAFAIARRSREFAVRVALGASHRHIVRLVTTHSVRLIAAGTICGIGATFALGRIVRASGGGGSFLDPEWTAFAVPVVILAAVGAIATLVPARRVLRIDPARVLRL